MYQQVMDAAFTITCSITSNVATRLPLCTFTSTMYTYGVELECDTSALEGPKIEIFSFISSYVQNVFYQTLIVLAPVHKFSYYVSAIA